LRIPGARIEELRSKGESLPRERFNVDSAANLIFWIGENRPATLAARVEIAQNLVTEAQAKVSVDQVRTQVAGDIQSAKDAGAKEATVRVATISAIASIAIAIVTGISTYYATKAKAPSGTSPSETGNTSRPPQDSGGTGSGGLPSAPAQRQEPKDPSSVPEIPLDITVDALPKIFTGPTCLLSTAGLYPYCVTEDETSCATRLTSQGGAFAGHHHCTKSPADVYCTAYTQAAGGQRIICYDSRERCDAGRLGYRVVPGIDTVDNQCLHFHQGVKGWGQLIDCPEVRTGELRPTKVRDFLFHSPKAGRFEVTLAKLTVDQQMRIEVCAPGNKCQRQQVGAGGTVSTNAATPGELKASIVNFDKNAPVTFTVTIKLPGCA
jgi:hypothetical protein